MKKFFLPFLILNFSFLIAFTSCSRKPADGEPVPIPPVNNFVMKNLVSEFPGEIRTAKFADKVQLVLFFRSDDPACRGSLADWNSLQKDFAPRGFTLVGAVVDERNPDLIAREVVALDISWPVGLAEPPIVAAFGGPAAIRAIPTAFLLSREGFVVRTYAGFEPIQNLRDDINALLDGREMPDRNPKPVAPEDNAP